MQNTRQKTPNKKGGVNSAFPVFISDQKEPLKVKIKFRPGAEIFDANMR